MEELHENMRAPRFLGRQKVVPRTARVSLVHGVYTLHVLSTSIRSLLPPSENRTKTGPHVFRFHFIVVHAERACGLVPVYRAS